MRSNAQGVLQRGLIPKCMPLLGTEDSGMGVLDQ